MNAHPDRTRFLRRSLQLDGVASGLCGVPLLTAVMLFTRLEVVGLARRREMVG